MENCNKIILFTKHFQKLDIEELIETIKSVGAEGADLCVRSGYPVEPENSDKKLPEVAEKFRKSGLDIPMITAPSDFVNPELPVAEKVFSACKISGIKLIKLGYWFMEENDYWKTVEKIRRALEKFVKLAEKYDVKVMIHNHSGGTMGLNSSSVMNLVKGFDPRYVGVFADTGHLSLVGEPLPMALSIVENYLSAIAIKDLIKERIIVEGKRNWITRVVPLGEGFVNWGLLPESLKEVNFTGPFSIHSEYKDLDIEDLIDQTRIDIRFFKRLINC